MAFGTYNQNTTLETSTVTRADLNGMLKEYLPYNLLMAEVEKRTYFIQKANKKTGYKGGVMPLPFEAGMASSYRYGKLIASNKITQSKYVKGLLEGYKEIWGAIKFDEHDLKRHDDMKQSFVGMLLKEVPTFAEGLRELISKAFLNGPDLATITDVTNAATGKIIVDRPELLHYGQYLELGATTAKQTGYVAAIDMNTREILVVTAISDVDAGSNPVDLTAVTAVIVGDTLRIEGGFDATLQFTDLPTQLLSATNGGSATLFGLSKVKYPFLQAYNHDGSGIAANNILGTIFDSFTRTKTIGKMANPNEVIMSYKNLANAMKELEATGSGIGTGRQFTAGDKEVNAFGWTKIQVTGVKGTLTLVGINEMRDDLIYGLDWRFIDIHSNGMIEKVVTPDGNEFYTERTEDGYVYIVDIRFFGELVVAKPCYQFVIHSINY